jgi:signal transduction histidine kinase
MEGARARRARRRPVAVPAAAIPAAALSEALLAEADTGVLILDPAGRVRLMNPAAGRMLGVAPARARGRAGAVLLRSVVAGEDVVGEALRRPRTERESVLATPGGGELSALVRSRRLGRPAWVLLTLRDLSQARRMREDLRRRERLATLGQLSAGVAHEIRNPLAGIGTSAQVLLRRFEPRDERVRFVKVILDEVARLDRIVTSLLQYARPRQPELQPGLLADCVRRALETQADSLSAAGVKVELEADPRLPPLWLDPDLIQQVLLNVVRNAQQAMPEGGTLRAEVRRQRRRAAPRGPGRRASDPARPAAADPGWLTYQQIRVSDTGVGIPRGTLAKLFDPFFTTKPQGTGLGLAISQTIMQEHGGAIEVASREGRGTTVLLNFPVEKRHGERRHPDTHERRSEHPAHRR